MSGGSYDYRHSKTHELTSWVNDLGDMAVRCRKWAEDLKEVMVRVPSGGGVTFRPATDEDRMRLRARGAELDAVAEELDRATQKVIALESLMHDVEWVASGDSHPGDLCR